MAGGGGYKKAALVAAITAATAIGYATASYVVAGASRLREQAPIAAVRALGGDDVGRNADDPLDIPAKGWWEILIRVASLVRDNRLMTEAAAVTFYSLLAIFPALTATVSFYGLFADPSDINRLFDAVADILPGGATDLLRSQLHALAANSHRGLTTGASLGLLAALWSANQGSKALFEALNTVYRETESRAYPLFVAQAMGFTLAAIVFVIAAMGGVLVLPEVLKFVGLSDVSQAAVNVLRWPVILVSVSLFLSAMYRFGPSREDPKWRWVTLGGALAAVSWVVVSFAFSWYVQNFGSFDKTYGSLGAVVGFMVWIWLSTLVALCGAQLNSEMEHQTSVDTTTGDPLPLGFRGATQADTVA